MKLDIGFDIDRGINCDFELTQESILNTFNKLYKNPFMNEWVEMEVGYNTLKKEPFYIDKALKELISSKKNLCVIGFGNGCKFNFTRRKSYYIVTLILTEEVLQNKIIAFRDYMMGLATSLPNFTRLIGGPDNNEYYELRKQLNLPQEKSLFNHVSWLNVVSPLAYDSYYEKEDLLKAPFYEVKEVAPDIVMIQAYKDPFDIENEESLTYLRKGVEYLNKHIIYLKGK